jgi:carbon monoxide dehydrogenase subunit G
MQLQHSFELTGPVEQAWDLLNKIDELAPCLPGASATRSGDDRFDGSVRMRMGPLDMTFKGTVDVVERDEAAHRVVLRSKGSEARGQGMASATTVANLSQRGDVTHVQLDTDLVITGRIAQMGRGMVVEISNDLFDRFVTNLKTKLAQSSPVIPISTALSAPVEIGECASAPAAAPATTAENSAPSGESLNALGLVWRILRRKFLRWLGLSRQP